MTSAISGTGTEPTAVTATGPTATAVTGTSGAVTQTISGLSTGLDTGAIIAQLVAAQRASREGPINSQIATANASLLAYSQIQAGTTILQAAARALSAPTAWQALTAQSSNPNAVVVSAGIGSSTGNLSFSVDRLATAGSVRSANIFNSGSAPLAADSAILLATGGQTIGFSTFASDNALTIGAHSVTVTQSSEGATKLGDTALGSSTIIDGTNDTMQLSIDGNPYTLTLAHGTYSATQLAAAVQDAATGAGAPLTASVDGATGKLSLATTEEGSAATLQITGGNALTALNLSTDGSPLTGVDGKVSVDGGPVQTFTSIAAGQAVTLNAAVGTISATFSGGLRAGTVNTMNVSTGDGSLQTVVGAINVANVGVIASAVQVGVNQYRLQLTSATTGVLHDLNVVGSELGAGAGGLVTVNQAADAELTIGSGPGAFTVTSGSNVVSGLMAGVTLTLVGKTTDQVTISSAHDSSGLADKIQAMVDAANQLHQTISDLTSYDATTKTAQPLTGDFSTSQLSNALATVLEDGVAGSALVSPSLVGVTADKTGTFKFDRSTFLAAYNANPSGISKMFTQGGSSANPDMSFISASDSTQGGSYSVNVTQLATQASSVGLNGTWPTGVASSIGVKVGSSQISYQVKATDTQADVVNGLNAAFATAGLALGATVNTDGIQIATVGYGHNSQFSVAWDGTNFSTFAGTDVAGTINGVAATGNGQQLLVPFATPGFGGLALNITGSTLGDLGTFTYSPGIAERVSTAVNSATDAVNGYITTAENVLHTQLQSFSDTIADMELQIQQYQSLLQFQFTNMETIISTLKTTGDTLTNALGQLPKLGG